jgi:hypothetical protein
MIARSRERKYKGRSPSSSPQHFNSDIENREHTQDELLLQMQQDEDQQYSAGHQHCNVGLTLRAQRKEGFNSMSGQALCNSLFCLNFQEIQITFRLFSVIAHSSWQFHVTDPCVCCRCTKIITCGEKYFVETHTPLPTLHLFKSSEPFHLIQACKTAYISNRVLSHLQRYVDMTSLNRTQSVSICR